MMSANPDPELVQEITELYFLVDVDTVLAKCVDSVENGRDHETVGRMLGKARNTLKYKLISPETRENREEQINQIRSSITRRLRHDLESRLKTGDQVEQAFMDMLSQPPGVQ